MASEFSGFQDRIRSMGDPKNELAIGGNGENIQKNRVKCMAFVESCGGNDAAC